MLMCQQVPFWQPRLLWLSEPEQSVCYAHIGPHKEIGKTRYLALASIRQVIQHGGNLQIYCAHRRYYIRMNNAEICTDFVHILKYSMGLPVSKPQNVTVASMPPKSEAMGRSASVPVGARSMTAPPGEIASVPHHKRAVSHSPSDSSLLLPVQDGPRGGRKLEKKSQPFWELQAQRKKSSIQSRSAAALTVAEAPVAEAPIAEAHEGAGNA